MSLLTTALKTMDDMGAFFSIAARRKPVVADKPWFVFRAQEWVLHDDTDAQVYF
jgi:hypothetical protein